MKIADFAFVAGLFLLLAPSLPTAQADSTAQTTTAQTQTLPENSLNAIVSRVEENLGVTPEIFFHIKDVVHEAMPAEKDLIGTTVMVLEVANQNNEGHGKGRAKGLEHSEGIKSGCKRVIALRADGKSWNEILQLFGLQYETNEKALRAKAQAIINGPQESSQN
jgi:hypothetical protein